jgi:imidazole glycerol-phosphate synthase subunit HisF
MLLHRVIPCLDVAHGRVVKGTRFLELRDEGDPAELAARYAAAGADEIVFLDIAATPEDRGALLDAVERTARSAFVPLTVGGGVRTVRDMRAVLRAGADRVSANTAAVRDPGLIDRCARAFGRQCVVVAIDARATAPGPAGRHDPTAVHHQAGRRDEADRQMWPVAPRWEVVVRGGREGTGIDAVVWAREAAARGAGELLVTSMDRDGTRDGYDLALLRAITSAVSIPVIASGGAGHPTDLVRAITEGGADAVLAASIFHRDIHGISAVKAALADAGVAVREVCHA